MRYHFTRFDSPACHRLTPDVWSTVWRCHGGGGMFVEKITTEDGNGVDVVLPNGRSVEVDACPLIRGCDPLSSVEWSFGNVTEWRTRQGSTRPHALFIRFWPRFDVQRNSYLVVMRLWADGACVVGAIPAVRGQTDRARALADRNAPCL